MMTYNIGWMIHIWTVTNFEVFNNDATRFPLFHEELYILKQQEMRSHIASLEKVVPAQVSSSSSDNGSKLRGSSQNSLRVASKRDVNITKLNMASHEA
ncbi:hypothetical protein AVEN_89608-1 [Araneus ventricosus]|uniref:Uncharacterized protein n=1 Tax=Araneus ventricosus TaxID=182803 RepID=A0A4Y2L411_ARAVE|nr:hypothetical protein AVEN_89608-1 [Araneus ventricosus]